jgi:hypothetical protein
MPGFALLALATVMAVPSPQDTGTVDAPVYQNAAYGVSIPRPFDDWVFEAGEGRQTTTVIFHPRALPLRDQLWGALVLTPFPGPVSLGRVVEQRIQTAWRRQLGSGFRLRAQDSLLVDGLPAIHVAMSGAIDGTALDVDEYAIARGGDLVVLQFRYPRGAPRDSVGAGYRRMLDGLRIRGANPEPEPAPLTPVTRSGATPRELPWSVWQARSYDALVTYDTASVRADLATRVDLVNVGPVAAESVTVWLWPALELDSLRSLAGPLDWRVADGVARFRLRAELQPQDSAVLTFFYHVSGDDAPAPLLPAEVGLSSDGAYIVTDWLPEVQPLVDSAGQLVRNQRPRVTMRFDVPEGWRAVASGRLTSDVVAGGRRRLTWTPGQVASALPAFAIGPYQSVTRRRAGFPVVVWVAPAKDTIDARALDSLVAAVRSGWTFCSRAFGRLPIAELNVASADVPGILGFAGLLLMGRGTVPSPVQIDSPSSLGRWRDVLYREIARTWWGNSVTFTGAGSGWLMEGLPAWSAIAARGALEGDTVRQRLARDVESQWRAGAAAAPDPPLSTVGFGDPRTSWVRAKAITALEAARQAAGEARFREGILAFALEQRNRWATLDAFLAAVGARGAAALRPFLF